MLCCYKISVHTYFHINKHTNRTEGEKKINEKKIHTRRGKETDAENEINGEVSNSVDGIQNVYGMFDFWIVKVQQFNRVDFFVGSKHR